MGKQQRRIGPSKVVLFVPLLQVSEKSKWVRKDFVSVIRRFTPTRFYNICRSLLVVHLLDAMTISLYNTSALREVSAK